MKDNAIIFVMLASALFVSCSKGEDSKPTLAPPTRVEAIKVQTSEIAGSRAYSGTIEESSGTVLSFPVSGTLNSITVSPGERVRRGQVVAVLDQTTLKNAYDIAKATLDQAQDAYDRMKMLHDSNSLPDMQWVEVQNALKQAQSGEAIAAKALKDAVLYSPVSGYVSEKYAEPGMTLAPIEPVVKIVDIDPVKVSIAVPENEIASISADQKAIVKVGAIDGGTFTGVVSEKGVAANPLSRAYDVKIKVDNPAGVLLPGMICDVTLQANTPRQEIVLPIDAVLLDADNQNFVWIKVDGEAYKRIVVTDGMTDSGIVISQGITPGDSVIVAGQQKVSEGTKVVSI